MRRVKAFECVWVVGGKDETPCAVAIMCNCRRENLISLVLVLGPHAVEDICSPFHCPKCALWLSGRFSETVELGCTRSTMALQPPSGFKTCAAIFRTRPELAKAKTKAGDGGPTQMDRTAPVHRRPLHCLAQDTLLFPAKLLRPNSNKL